MSRAIHKMCMGGSPSIKSVTLTATAENTTGGNPYSFTSLSIGAAPTGGDRRYVIAVCHMTDNNPSSGGGTIGTITIDGSTATKDIYNFDDGVGSAHTAIGRLEVSAGTTTTVSFTTNGNMNAGGVSIYRVITGAAGLALSSTGQSDGNGAACTPATIKPGGVVFGATTILSTSSTTRTVTWSGGLVEDTDRQLADAGATASVATLLLGAAPTVTPNASGSDDAMANVAAAYEAL